MERLKKTIGDAKPGQPVRKTTGKGPGIIGDPKGVKKILELVDLYRVEIAYQVQKNWAFSESLAGNRKDLVVELAFTVKPNGEIRDIWFDRRSGSRYLGDSAKKAVMKSNPVAPHPEGVVEPYVTVGLRFTPEGVR